MSIDEHPYESEGPRKLSELSFIGSGFARPECVLATQKGELFASDKRGGVRCLDASGTTRLIGAGNIIPNGIAMLRDRSFMVANLAGIGGVWKIDRHGNVAPHLMEIDGVRLPGVNFVTLDSQDRLWICVSTLNPEAGQYSKDSRDGFIALQDKRGTRVVAWDMCWTNECRVSAGGDYLYVNETFARRLTRFRLRDDGTLVNREVTAEFGAGVFPDGLALDSAGCAWIVSVGTNRVIRVERDGRQTTIIDDSDTVDCAKLEELHCRNALTRPVLAQCQGAILSNISSIAFGGPDLRTAFLGSLGGESIACFRVNTPGLAPPHWNW
jgi:sugar lactone lactonase YvrE